MQNFGRQYVSASARSSATLRSLGGAIAAASLLAGGMARAQDAPTADEHFSRFRVAGSWFGENAQIISFAGSGSSIGVSYDFLRLSHVPGSTRDPAALSLHLLSVGDNPLHETEGSQLIATIDVRTPARPVYVRLGLGVSHDTNYTDFNNYYYSFVQEDVLFYRTYAPNLSFEMQFYLGVDIPRTPVFLELGGQGDFDGLGGLSLQLGVRL